MSKFAESTELTKNQKYEGVVNDDNDMKNTSESHNMGKKKSLNDLVIENNKVMIDVMEEVKKDEVLKEKSNEKEKVVKKEDTLQQKEEIKTDENETMQKKN